MALEAAVTQSEQMQILESSLSSPCPFLHNFSTLNTNTSTESVTSPDAWHDVEIPTSLQLTSESSDVHSHVGSSVDCLFTKRPTRNSSKRKNRKHKGTRKSAAKVHPEIQLTYDTEDNVLVNIESERLDEFCKDLDHSCSKFSESVSSQSSCISGANENCLNNAHIMSLSKGETGANGNDKDRNHVKSHNRKEESHSREQKFRKGGRRVQAFREKRSDQGCANTSIPTNLPHNGCCLEPIKAAVSTEASESADAMTCVRVCIDVIAGPSPYSVEEKIATPSHQRTLQTDKGLTDFVDLYDREVNLNSSFRRKSSGRRDAQGHGPQSFRFQKGFTPHMEPMQQKFPHETKFTSKGRGTFNSRPLVKMPRTKLLEDRNLHTHVDRQSRNSSCLESQISTKVKHRQDVNDQTSSRKWVPVCKKEVKPSNSAALMDNCIHLDDRMSSLSEASTSSEPGNITSICNHENTKVTNDAQGFQNRNSEVKGHKIQHFGDIHPSFDLSSGSTRSFIGAQMAEQAFSSSYRLQLASECIQQATGYPLAKFERLLFSVSPVITSSFSCPTCDGQLDNQPCVPSLCRDQTPNISLQAVWNWYEEPGNFGLKVNLEDSWNQKGSIANAVSFHAHFVPLLSAVQLFGHHQLSTCCSESQEQAKPGSEDREANLPCSDYENLTITTSQEPTIENPCQREGDTLSVGLPSLFNDTELIFQFFESELPQHRMPLYSKIMELSGAGTSNNRVFGDPSKLVCTNLHDLHPASWFSVAWYPIYRIPEGKLRAAFLTYHSLGYLVHRCIATDALDRNALCIVFPVIGLQSYNAQGERWFQPKTDQVKTSVKGVTSELLKDRLRTLEENALLFARGLGRKDNHVTTANRQPDYEFFVSRKH